MSKWTKKRKTRIVVIILILMLLILAIVIYFILNKPATCFDSIQNGNETGIDCGGNCQRVCSEESNNIVVWWERPFKITDGVYNLVAYFENQNFDAGIEEIFYEFRVYDKNNILVAEPIVGSTFIESNKRSAIFESGLIAGSQKPYNAFIKFLTKEDWKKVEPGFSYSLFSIDKEGINLIGNETSPRLSAQIKNETFFDLYDVQIIAILYNQKDNAIASSQTYIDEILQGQTQEVYFTWPEAFSSQVSRIEIIPRVNPFIARDLSF